MEFKSKFDIGDKVWVPINGTPFNYTIGQIRIEHTDSPGIDGEEMFDNYKSKKKHVEAYMCVESGIGSGALWELGKNIFATKEECESAISKMHGLVNYPCVKDYQCFGLKK